MTKKNAWKFRSAMPIGLKFVFAHTRRRGEPLIQINPRLEEEHEH